MLRHRQADPRRNPGLAALGSEVEGGDFNERITWCDHTDVSHMVVLSHRAVDGEAKRYGVAAWKGSRHLEIQAIRLGWCLSGQALYQCWYIVGILIRARRRDHGRRRTSSDAGQKQLTPRQACS